MAKRIRKPPIQRDVRRDWLRRNEANGESPPQIATKEHFDVRTVRKQIELAKQEREAHEAKSLVLRNAMENHYEDLRKCAEKLNSKVSGLKNILYSPDDDLIEAALRQHLPRSPIWSYMAKWQNLNEKENEQKRQLGNKIAQDVKEDKRLVPLVEAGLTGIVSGFVLALTFQADQWLYGSPGLNLKENLLSEPGADGLVTLRYGAFRFGEVKAEQADNCKEIIRKVLKDLESKLKELDIYQKLVETKVDIKRLTTKLREELAVIRLRRIVTGRCKYCPL